MNVVRYFSLALLRWAYLRGMIWFTYSGFLKQFLDYCQYCYHHVIQDEHCLVSKFLSKLFFVLFWCCKSCQQPVLCLRTFEHTHYDSEDPILRPVRCLGEVAAMKRTSFESFPGTRYIVYDPKQAQET